MNIEIYTDGGCLNNGKPYAIAAYGYYFPNHPHLSHAAKLPTDQPQTNNRGELLGISEGIKKAQDSFPQDSSLHIFTDSQYSKNCITTWLSNWIARGWKTTTGTPVINRDLIEDISERLGYFESYTITHVRAHTGRNDDMSKYNHIVDRLVSNVLTPSIEIISTETVKGPLQLMGPPISETALYKWCIENMDEIDETELRSGIISAYTKTMRKNGYEVKKTKLHRTYDYRLFAVDNLVVKHN